MVCAALGAILLAAGLGRRSLIGDQLRPAMMQAGMASEAGTTTAKPVLQRDQEHRVIAGVCAGIGNRLDVDPLVVRIVFVAAAAAGAPGWRPVRARRGW